MRFLFVRPRFCLQLPSDSTSQWTPLLFGYALPTTGCARDFHPLDFAHAGRTAKTTQFRGGGTGWFRACWDISQSPGNTEFVLWLRDSSESLNHCFINGALLYIFCANVFCAYFTPGIWCREFLRHCISGQGSSLRCMAAILFLLGLVLHSGNAFNHRFWRGQYVYIPNAVSAKFPFEPQCFFVPKALPVDILTCVFRIAVWFPYSVRFAFKNMLVSLKNLSQEVDATTRLLFCSAPGICPFYCTSMFV